MRIMFEQLPDVDKILRLCRSVYMVRENKQYLLEEELYSKIIFLYRSPETMIKYTKKEKEKQETMAAIESSGLRQRRKTHSRNASATQGVVARSADDDSRQNKRSASLISLSSLKKDD